MFTSTTIASSELSENSDVHTTNGILELEDVNLQTGLVQKRVFKA